MASPRSEEFVWVGVVGVGEGAWVGWVGWVAMHVYGIITKLVC